MQEQLYTDYTGGSNAHNNLPPYITSIPCIKAFDSVIDATTVSVAQLSDTKVNKAGDTMTGSLTAPSFITNGIDCSVDSQGDGWIRYSNGIQICWGENSSPVTFPRAFNELPAITLTHRTFTNAHVNITKSNASTSSFEFVAYVLGFNETPDTSANYIAIGRWK
jgi:hypothetical protein